MGNSTGVTVMAVDWRQCFPAYPDIAVTPEWRSQVRQCFPPGNAVDCSHLHKPPRAALQRAERPTRTIEISSPLSCPESMTSVHTQRTAWTCATARSALDASTATAVDDPSGEEEHEEHDENDEKHVAVMPMPPEAKRPRADPEPPSGSRLKLCSTAQSAPSLVPGRGFPPRFLHASGRSQPRRPRIRAGRWPAHLREVLRVRGSRPPPASES